MISKKGDILMDMDVSNNTCSSYNVHPKNSYESFCAKKQEELRSLKRLGEAAKEAKSTTSEEDSISLSNNKRMLKAMLEMARATSANVYTEDSIKNLAESMSKAAAVSVSKNAKASDVNKALSYLRSGLSSLRVADKKDKKGNSGEMLESDLIQMNGSIKAAQDAKDAAAYGSIVGSVNVSTAGASTTVTISVTPAIVPTIDISL